MKKIFFFLLVFCASMCVTVLAQSGADDAIGSLQPRAAYYDGEGVLKMIAFKIDEVPSNLTFVIDGREYEVTADAEQLLYGDKVVFQETADGIAVSGKTVDVLFKADGAEFSVQLPAVKIMEGSDEDWAVSDDGHALVTYKGAETLITVPNFINGKAITAVGGGKDKNSITKASGAVINSAVISDGITDVSYGAFANMSALTAVVLPDTLIRIDDGGFYGTGLSQEIEFPASLRSIGAMAFRQSSVTGVKFNSGLEWIGDQAFALCGSLSVELEFPASLRSIGAMAFQQSSVTGVKFNSGLEQIGNQAFAKCANLGGGLVLPDTLKSIGKYAFFECSGLTGALELPASLETLGVYCFCKCSGFTGDLTVPGNIKSIPEGAFCLCTGINGKVTLCEGVEETGYMSLSGDSSAYMKYTELELPSTLKHIGQYCFQFCNSVRHLELNEGLEFISDGAFDHMSGIDNEVLVIPSTVKTIGGDYDKNDRGYNTGCGDHIFYDMGKDSSFKAFEVAEGNAYFKAKDGVLFNADMTRLVAYPRGKTDEVYEIPEGVVQLDAMCFSRPAYLKKLVLPDSFVISEEVPDNSLNQDGNNLAVAIYTFSRLEEIAVKETNPAFVTEDGLLYSKDKTVLWYAPLGKSGDIVISDKCRFAALGFAYMANNGYVKWNSLTIPASVEHIYADTVDDKLNRVMTGKIIVESGSLYYTVNESGKLEAIKYADGDIDMSGSVDEKDAELLLSYLSDMTLSVPINLNPADMDGNGSINVADVILIEDKL